MRRSGLGAGWKGQGGCVSRAADIQHMARALDLAKEQTGRTGKNPAVGCVIVSAEGQVLAEGVTSVGGQRHAEQAALDTLKEAGAADSGTAYVTLEPCRQRSAGGMSCSERLISAGIGRVVCAISDRHPNGSGGLLRLVNAGITVEIGLMSEEATALYNDFFSGL